mgnify:CR=1 FL=1
MGEELLLRPAREASVIARLGAMTRRIPKDSITAIWRELMAINLQAHREVRCVQQLTAYVLKQCADESARAQLRVRMRAAPLRWRLRWWTVGLHGLC